MSTGYGANQHQGGRSPERLDPIIRVSPELAGGILSHLFSELGTHVRNEITENDLTADIIQGKIDYTRVIDTKPYEKWANFITDQRLLDNLSYIVTLGVQAAVDSDTGRLIYPDKISNGFVDRSSRIAWVSVGIEPPSTS